MLVSSVVAPTGELERVSQMTSPAGAQKRFRFTLRSLLAAVTALSIVLGIVTAIYRWQADKAKREAAKAWVVELRGYTYHQDAAAEWIIEFQWPQPEPASTIESVEAQYYDDLRPVLEQLTNQKP
jgi:hypothetical protein